eukprot:gene1744-3367_t
MTEDSIIKAAILSEIEEGQSQSAPRPPKIQDEVLSICADRDFKLSSDALQRAILNGVDPRFTRGQRTSKKLTITSPRKPKNVDDSILEDQFDVLLSRLELFEEEWVSGEEDNNDNSARERILGIRLSKNSFEPLMQSLKDTHPVLYRALLQHTMISGRQRTKRTKHSRKNRKKEKRDRERDRDEKESKDLFDDNTNTTSTSTPTNKIKNNTTDATVPTAENLPVWDQYRQVLAMMVAKCIADNSIQSQLLLIALLLQIYKNHGSTSTSTSTSISSEDELSIPIGNIIAAVFERPETDEMMDTDDDNDNNDGNNVQSHHFKTAGAGTGGGTGAQGSASGIGGIGASGTTGSSSTSTGLVEGEEDVISQHGGATTTSLFSEEEGGGGGGSSTVGSSTMAEQGTETASLLDTTEGEGDGDGDGDRDMEDNNEHEQQEDEGNDDEDLSEEELLAQAMAMSLATAAASAASAIGSATASGSGLRSNRTPPPLPNKTVNNNNNNNITPASMSMGMGMGSGDVNPPHVSRRATGVVVEGGRGGDNSSNKNTTNTTTTNTTTTNHSHSSRSVLHLQEPQPEIPHRLPFIPPLATFGPFGHIDFWNILFNTDGFAGKTPSSVPILHVIFSLLMYVSASSDDVLGENPLPINTTNNTSSTSTNSKTTSNTNANKNNKYETNTKLKENKEKSKYLPLCGTCQIVPHTVTFLLLEFLLEVLMSELKKMSEQAFNASSVDEQRSKSKSNIDVEYDLENSPLLSSTSTSTSTSNIAVQCEIDTKQWKFQRYFYVWSICSVLKVLRAHLSSLESSKMTASSLGLGLGVGLSSGSSPEASPIKCDNNIDIALVGLGIQKLRMTTPNYTSMSSISDDSNTSSATSAMHSDKMYRHAIRMAGIDTYISGLCVFYPTNIIIANIFFFPFMAMELKGFLEKFCLAVADGDVLNTNSNNNHRTEAKPTTNNQPIPSNLISSSTSTSTSTSTSNLLEGLTASPSSSASNIPRIPSYLECGWENLSIGNRGRSVTQKNLKSWGTVLATKGFESDTGIHEWCIRVDKCEKGDIFIGVCTSEASVDTYVGGDKYGWGMIATRSLWHNQTKVRSDYGGVYNQSIIITVILDTDNRKLSFSTESHGSWGVAFDTLPRDQMLYPAVSVYYRDDQITLFPSSNITSSSGGGSSSGMKKNSMEEYDDEMELLEGNRDSDSTLQLLLGYSPFLKYSKTICNVVNNILKAAEAMDDEHKRETALSHPFIGLFLPSLAASLVAIRTPIHATSLLSLHLLPLLLIITKRLSASYEKQVKNVHDNIHKYSLIDDISGIWLIKSSAAGNNIPAQEYYLEFDDNNNNNNNSIEKDNNSINSNENENNNGDDDDNDNNNTSNSNISNADVPIKLTGRGVGGNSAVVVKGTVFGTRIKFQETWTIGTNCIVEGRLSLDGNSFTGVFKDAKTSTTGSLEGSRVTSTSSSSSSKQRYISGNNTSNTTNNNNTVFKSALLCSMAFGKLSALLVVGFESIHVGGTTSTSLSDNTITSTSEKMDVDSATPVEVEVEGEGEQKGIDWSDENENTPANVTDIDGNDNENDNQIEETKHEDNIKENTHIKTSISIWMKSIIFSGGLPFQSQLIHDIKFEIEKYLLISKFSNTNTTATSTTNMNMNISLLYENDCSLMEFQRNQSLHYWWLKTIFPQLYNDNNVDTKLKSELISPDIIISKSGVSYPSILPVFLIDMIDGRGRAKHLDEYVTQHIGSSAMNKIGGEPMQAARKCILAAIIYLSGCLTLCESEENALDTHQKQDTERPHELLIEVWRATQRVIENAIWRKQQSGITYVISAQNLCKKVELLLCIIPSKLSENISKLLENIKLTNDHNDLKLLQNNNINNITTEIQVDFSRLITEAIEFLQSSASSSTTSSIRLVDALRNELLKTCLRAVSRIAGFKAFRAFMSKLEDVPVGTCTNTGNDTSGITSSLVRLPPLSLSLQSAAVEYILPALIGHIDLHDRVSSYKSIPSESLLLVSSSSSSSTTTLGSNNNNGNSANTAAAEGSSSSFSGHYLNGLKGCSEPLTKSLRQSVEAVYTLITQLLQRATWANDRDAQCAALSPWGLNVQPDDHVFLNHVGIFRILQAVMEGVRSSMNGSSSSTSSSSESETDPCTLFSYEVVCNSNRRVAQLVLRIVHALASQVAFTKVPEKSHLQSIRMNRMLSGPETLSQALFDMLFSELHYGLRKIVMNVFINQNNNIVKKRIVTSTTPAQEQLTDGSMLEEFLDGEQYVYRILRLLFSVSGAPVCQTYLLTPKWITLLLSAIGCGSLIVQRRLLRLIRRLLVAASPESCKSFVCDVFSDRTEIIDSDISFSDDDARMLCENQNQSIMDQSEERTTDGSPSSSSLSQSSSQLSSQPPPTVAERIVTLLLESVSAFIPPAEAEGLENETDNENGNQQEQEKPSAIALLRHLNREGMESSLSSESISILRQLHETAAWLWENHSKLRMMAASLAVLGGYVDRLRPGGLVLLRPFSLAGVSESFALRLAAASHSCAMVLSRSVSSHSVEVVLMERSRRISRTTSSSNSGNSQNGSSSQLSSSTPSPTSTSTFFIPAVASVPAKSVKISEDDILPTWDCPVSVEHVPTTLLVKILEILDTRGLLWLRKLVTDDDFHMRNNDENDDERNNKHSSSRHQQHHTDPADNDEEDEDNDDDDEDDNDDDEEEKGEIIENEEKTDDNNTSPTSTSSKTPLTSIEALEVYVLTSTFRSTANLMQHDPLANTFALSPERFREILSLSVIETRSGGLGVIEQIEQRWATLWELMSAMRYKELAAKDSPSDNDGNGGGSSGGGANTSSSTTKRSDPMSVLAMESARVSHAIVTSIASRLDAAASAASMNILASLGSPVGIDPAAARRHMMEMGFPKEWCEVALRRCRYNVEMAINLCFEQGTDMDQLVAEDAAIMNANAARSNNPRRFLQNEFNEPNSNSSQRTGNADSEPSSTSTLSSSTSESINMPGRVFLSGRPARASGGGSGNDTSMLMKQLLEMGFPPTWCAKALAVNQNNVDAALTWILSHGEDLVSDEDLDGEVDVDVEGGGVSVGGDGGEVSIQEEKQEDETFGPNPLSMISGSANINNDLTCTISHMNGFPSIGCRGFGVVSGKWFYEIRLHTAGCIQLGWADSAYEGNAENGQGVGDDCHSWAYDGWRLYLWHETYAEWGSKWSPGDVIGCGIDMDNKTMSFFLNGYGEEIRMGIAFQDFISAGGMYPCASFNLKEQIQFNFGAIPFKYPPPAGYSPFIDHIHDVLELSSMYHNEALLDAWNSNTNANYHFRNSQIHSRHLHSNIHDNNSNGHTSYPWIEDSMEEQRGENDFLWQKRYFNVDEGRPSQSNSPRLPVPNLPSTIPTTDKLELSNQFLHISKDLCILYSRLIILRIIAAYPRIPESCDSILSQLLGSNMNFESFSKDNQMADKFLLLIRLCGCSSSRTKVYLQTMSILSSTQSIPANIGSLLIVGGAPMLQAIQPSITILIRHTRDKGNTSFIESLLHQISIDTFRATRREYVSEWRLEGCFSPAIFKDGPLVDSNVIEQPTLQFAVWISILIMDQFAHESIGMNTDEDQIWTDIIEWLIVLCRHWCKALRSPSMAVKLCALRMLLVMIQEVTTPGGRFVRAPSELLVAMLHEIPVNRLDRMVLWRLQQERGNMPVCSEFLQTLLELVTAIGYLKQGEREADTDGEEREGNSDTSTTTRVPSTDIAIDIPSKSVECSAVSTSNDNSTYNWESISGLNLSDDGWDTWTGSVSHHSTGWKTATLVSDKPQDQAPELLPGCKVAKKRQLKRSLDTEEEESNEEGGTGSSSGDLSSPLSGGGTDRNRDRDREREPLSPVLSDEGGIITSTSASRSSQSPRTVQPRLSSKQATSTTTTTTASSRRSSIEYEEVIGTVIGIESWPDCGPGSARIIQWDSSTSSSSSSSSNDAKSNSNNIEIVRWGANGEYDVTHVQCNKQGKIIQRYSKTVSPEIRATRQLFGLSRTFGVILRLRDDVRKDTDNSDILGRIDGIMEWPDFAAIIYVKGIKWIDGNITITEEKLLSGANHSEWTIRFGSPNWRSGTTYELSTSKTVSDSTSGRAAVLIGQFSYKVSIGQQSNNVIVSGDIRLQKARLFSFDDKFCGRPIVISSDKWAASCSGEKLDGRPCVYGNIGFSTGVHYWEYKIDQADLGSVFIGIAEKPGVIGMYDTGDRLKRWQGLGAVNIRLSYRAPSSSNGGSTSGKEQYYGDHFHTGDTVGVLLDMNRGRLSFFLDGMKYGEHTLADLGEAFDGLVGTGTSSSNRVKPRTYFPVVGFRKVGDRSADRIVLTPKWLSCFGPCTQSQTMDLVMKAWGLLTSWGCDRPGRSPLQRDMWVYREAWRDWLRWKSGRYVKVRTRCKTPMSLLLVLDTSIRACVDASIRLGLSVALFRGDRVFFTKSCGKPLETKEEAVILGAYDGQLWYRLDSQQGDGGLQEGSSAAWCLASYDVESMIISRRAGGENTLPAAIVNIELPRIPVHHGGRLRVVYEGGAVIRDGLEIDTSDVIGTVELNAEVYAIERRINSSNIPRYRVLYQGKFGWISECIRGGTEEAMVTRILIDDPIATANGKMEASIATQSQPDKVNFRIDWSDVNCIEIAMKQWERIIRNELNMDNWLVGNTQHSISDPSISETFDSYLELSCTIDGVKNWAVEADMQLSEVISKLAAREGLSPQNLPYKHVIDAMNTFLPENPSTCLLVSIPMERILARASILRVANQVIGHALPYLNTVLPEEKWRLDRVGTADDVDVVSTAISPPPTMLPLSNNEGSTERKELFPLPAVSGRSLEETWFPPCGARRLRSLRRILFSYTKRVFWESILEATTTPTSLQQDEYEDPKDIKVIRINRVRATHSRLASITNATDRVKQSVFGQLHKEMRGWNSSAFRRSYLGKGHGGQKRAFKVKFTGEGVNDYGGPYRADELQADNAVVTSSNGRPWERCLLPLLYPCPNRVNGVGANQDKFILSPAPPSPMTQELMQYFGKLVGTAVRHNLNLALDLSSMLWRPLVRLPTSRAHLETIDILTTSSLKKIEELGLTIEKEWSSDNKQWSEMNFTITLSDGGVRMQLCPNGDDIPVTVSNWRDFIHLADRFKLKESISMYKVFRDGLSAVLPMDLFPIFTAMELEHLISGTSKVNLKLLKQCTEYDFINPNCDLVRNFWEILEEMSDEERTLFLRFVWARSRMPASAQELPMNFKLQGAQGGGAVEHPDVYLPHAQTCFFSLSLPAYSSKEILRNKLLYAINNSPNMDADVRLHSAEGWADS